MIALQSNFIFINLFLIYVSLEINSTMLLIFVQLFDTSFWNEESYFYDIFDLTNCYKASYLWETVKIYLLVFWIFF